MLIEAEKSIKLEIRTQGFPGGSVVENPLADAGDTGLIPDLGRSTCHRATKTRASQQLSLCSKAREPQRLKPMCLETVLRNKRSQHNEKTANHNSRVIPAHLNQRIARAATKT